MATETSQQMFTSLKSQSGYKLDAKHATHLSPHVTQVSQGEPSPPEPQVPQESKVVLTPPLSPSPPRSAGNMSLSTQLLREQEIRLSPVPRMSQSTRFTPPQSVVPLSRMEPPLAATEHGHQSAVQLAEYQHYSQHHSMQAHPVPPQNAVQPTEQWPAISQKASPVIGILDAATLPTTKTRYADYPVDSAIVEEQTPFFKTPSDQSSTRMHTKRTRSPSHTPTMVEAMSSHTRHGHPQTREKQTLLIQLEKMRQLGVNISRNFSMNDSVHDIQYELESQRETQDTVSAVNFMKSGLKVGFSGIELFNDYMGAPLHINNLANDMSQNNMQSYNRVLEKIYTVYLKRRQNDPIAELFLLMSSAVLMQHFKNKMSSISNLMSMQPGSKSKHKSKPKSKPKVESSAVPKTKPIVVRKPLKPPIA